jgi:hypothetical protein
MNVPLEQSAPSDLAVAISDYGVALGAVDAGTGGGPAGACADAVVKALLARDRVARLVGAGREGNRPPGSEELEKIAALDRQLKSQAASIVSVVGRGQFADWRGAMKPAEGAWWWTLEEHAPRHRSRLGLVATFLSWVLIAVSLSFILEIVRRFIGGGADLPSTVVQGLLGLLAGGTVVQWARKVVESGRQGEGAWRLLGSHRSRLVAAGVLLAVAFLLNWARPRAAGAYNDWGVRLQREGRLTDAIQKYQRSISLGEPHVAWAHFNLGDAYESVLEYDKAMTEYKSAILTDNTHYFAYNNLARLYIVVRGDHAGALKLIDRALTLEIKGPSDERSYVEYALYKNRGWAYLGLKNYKQAKDDLQQALRLNGEGAEAYCLLAQVSEAEKNADAARDNWQACSEYLRQQGVEAEPTWRGLARERLK